MRQIRITTSHPHAQFDLLLVTPNDATSPLPCFIGANFTGNHTIVANAGIRLSEAWIYPEWTSGDAHASALDRGRETSTWGVADVVASGYGLATFYCGEVVQDRVDLALETLPGFDTGAGRPATTMVWAWALSRVLDVLTEASRAGDLTIDSGRVIAVGHSRLGRAALLAAAFDDRFAAAIPSQAGCAGAAPARISPELSRIGVDGRPTAETLAWITSHFPHWFSPRLADHAADVFSLPVDQHLLLAVCAPRPLLLANGEEDAWADPAGQFEMLRAADPVYELLRSDGLRVSERPRVGELSPGPLAYSLRAGGHSMVAEDWPTWIRFADRWVTPRADPPSAP